jgi:hypothetical protein
VAQESRRSNTVEQPSGKLVGGFKSAESSFPEGLSEVYLQSIGASPLQRALLMSAAALAPRGVRVLVCSMCLPTRDIRHICEVVLSRRAAMLR